MSELSAARRLIVSGLFSAVLLGLAPSGATAGAAAGPQPSAGAAAAAPVASTPSNSAGSAAARSAGARPAVPAVRQVLQGAATGLDPRVLGMALDAASCAGSRGLASEPSVLTVIDYSLPSTKRRLWVLDLDTGEVLFHELVAHGMNTGENFATRFSNVNGSKQSSLGLFVTADTYIGKNGYSLRLEGLEPGINDLALERTIVVHGAPYVSRQFIRAHGRLGRSWGCPALEDRVARPLIDTIKNGSLVFIHYPDDNWLASSGFLGGCGAGVGGTVTAAAG
jgi:hypothetical protein